MVKYNKLLRNITELIEKGFYNSRDLRNEVENTIKYRLEIITNKLNLVSREEFEIQKIILEKVVKDLNKIKSKKNKSKTKRAKRS